MNRSPTESTVTTSPADPSEGTRAPSRSVSVRPALAFWLIVSLLLAGGTVARLVWPAPSSSVADQAETLLRSYKENPLAGDLDTLLAEPEKYYVRTIEHPLVGQPAPDFTLRDWQGKTVRLADSIAQGPVILIFYYGYWCDHCVVQLYDIHEDLARFKALGARVIAVSADPPAETAAKFAQFGAFDFDTLSDPDNKVARLYDCYDPPADNEEAKLFHGTFVIDQTGQIVWADIGDKPFQSNKTLLFQLAWMQGKLPPSLANFPGPR